MNISVDLYLFDIRNRSGHIHKALTPPNYFNANDSPDKVWEVGYIISGDYFALNRIMTTGQPGLSDSNFNYHKKLHVFFYNRKKAMRFS